MTMQLEELEAKRKKIQEAIDNVLEAGQEFQTRNGRVKQASLEVLQRQLATVESDIADLKGNTYTDTEIFVFRGCR